ncbi:hypothetical protein GCM10017673_48270 [Streptosporangium violaceochromogenes]|nr:hypothetical protein GCM10017673_48270 [Streptosporangium violaceochromogenes]
MRTWVKGTAPAALLALGVMTLGNGTALADTSGDFSVLGGNQVVAPITLPIDISGNAAAVAGGASAASRGGASADASGTSGAASDGPGTTSGRGSVLGGNQVTAPITAPINACGNAVALLGGSRAACRGGASVSGSGGGRGAGGNRTSGEHSVLGGNQITAPITAPVNACGNSVALLGGSEAACQGGASVSGSTGGPGRGRGAGGNTTSGRWSVLGGNQVVAPITAPVNVCGNSAAVAGGAFSGCKGGAEVTDRPGRPRRPGYHSRPGSGSHSGWWRGVRPGSGGNDTDGRFAAGSGNQVIAPIVAPVNACGNAVGNADAACAGHPSVVTPRSGSGAGGNTTSGRGSVLGGNQVVAPVTAPVNVCGNAVALFGGAFAGCKGGASVVNGGGPGSGAGGNTTSGRGSVLGGNQVVAPVTAPVNVCGNAVAVLGDAAAGCLGGSHAGAPVTGGRRWAAAPTKHRTSGLVPALPEAPAGKEAGDLPRPAGRSGVPALAVVKEARDVAGLPEVPALPVTPGRGGKAPMAGQGPARTAKGNSALAPATDLISSTSAGDALPVRDLGLTGAGLMSAAQPIGVTGMNTGSLLALVLGGLAAASATLFAVTRRLRPAKR